MCGILFQYIQGVESEELISSAERALSRLSHRGPDDEGLWCEPPCVIGHRRLSIIDLEKSRQPMEDPSNRFVLSYNGEVYNYKELRKSLQQRWEFKTQGDTEVILAGLIIYGVYFLKQMEGMWAIAFWDNKCKTLLLVRDRMGKKPLFYQCINGSFACASELSALASLSTSEWNEDINSTADYLRYGYYLPGRTAYMGVHEVLPGHTLKWSPPDKIEQKPYWTLSLNRNLCTKEQIYSVLKDSIINAVKRRLVADVEVGAFLSGGVDSSLIVSILTKELGIRPKTFTIGFSDPAYDERKYAQKIAQLCHTEHFNEQFEEWDRERLTSLILKHVGQPFSDSSLLPTSMVSEFASRHVKVALSGDGGDELFCGYERYQARVFYRWFTRLPIGLRKNIQKIVRMVPEPMAHHSRSLLKKAHLFVDILERQEHQSTYVAPTWYTDEEFKLLAPDLVGKGHTPPSLPHETSEGSLLEMMTADALIYLPQDILTKVDRASMAHSLETRAPFLDHKVVELAFSLPDKWHRRKMRGKRMLQETFFYLLPKEIWHRRKQGFAVPMHQWFQGKLSNQFKDLLHQVKSPVQSAFAKNLLQMHTDGVKDQSHRLWTLYVYLLWMLSPKNHI